MKKNIFGNFLILLFFLIPFSALIAMTKDTEKLNKQLKEKLNQLELFISYDKNNGKVNFERILIEITNLINQEADPDTKSTSNNSLLNLISQIPSANYLLLFLLSKKANINSRDNEGNTPLINAVKANNLEAVNILLNHNAYIKAINSDKNNVLYYVAHSGNLELARRLIDGGIITNSTKEQALKAKHQAKRKYYFGIINLINEALNKLEAEDTKELNTQGSIS